MSATALSAQRPEVADKMEVLTSWAREATPAEIQDARFQRAFEAIDSALIETIRYMRDRKAGRAKNDDDELKLTLLWSTASTAVSPIDGKLATACNMKAWGWTDPAIWEAAKQQGIKVGIEDMENARMLLNTRRQEAASIQTVPAWFPIAGAGFCVITILFLMYYVVLGPPLESGKKIAFDALMAFCASASAGFIGGSAITRGQIPFFGRSPITFSAVGGIGTFIVVFLILHYAA